MKKKRGEEWQQQRPHVGASFSSPSLFRHNRERTVRNSTTDGRFRSGRERERGIERERERDGRKKEGTGAL
jgi:hypothetical protein